MQRAFPLQGSSTGAPVAARPVYSIHCEREFNMNRFNVSMAVALLGASVSAGALAGTTSSTTSQNPDKTQAMASHKDKMAAKHSTTSHQALAASDVRNWKAIDKNHDNLIEPDEMEANLKQGWAKSKSAQQK
jgi:hypothetical protein